MEQVSKKDAAKGDLPARIENSRLGRILILFFDLFFLLLRKSINLFRKKEGNLIIISLRRLGDTVFTIPAVGKILEHYNNYNKIIFCFPESETIYKLVFNEKIITLNKNDFNFGNRIASSGIRKILKENSPEIIYDLTGDITSASIIFNSTALEIIGMNDRIFKNIYNRYTPKRKVPHLIDTYLDIVKLAFPVERSNELYRFNYKGNKKGKILIHPFAGWKAKEWNFGKFIKLGGVLSNNYEVAFIAKKDMISNMTQDELKELNIRVITTKTVEDLINELKKCSVIISNDSGPVYIASLLGVPTFSIYGPTNPAYSVPFGEHHEYIQKIIECSPEENKQYCFTDAGRNGCPSFECMNLLTVEEVLQKLNPFLNRIDLRPKAEVADDKNR